MTYPVASLTLDGARSYVMHGASFTQWIVSSIPIGGGIIHGGFLPSILLLVVIMVVVVIVVVTVILVVIVVVKVIIVIIGVVVVVGDKTFDDELGYLLWLFPEMIIPTIDLIGDKDPTDEDGDIEVSVSLDEVIKSSAKNLLPIPSEYEVTFNDENECDVPVKDESFPVFITFSNPIFDCNDDFTSSDDESIFDEDVLIDDFKVYSNPLFDDEIDLHCFNAESDFVESLFNRDTLIDSSLKFDFLEEFSGALLPTSIADEEHIRREHKEYISHIEKLFSINSFPRPLENFHANTIVETLPSYIIPVEDSYSQREEIDIFTGMDELLPPDIKSDNYDSKGDIHFHEELLFNDSISLPENESFYFGHHDDPSFPRPPPEPPDVAIFFKPDSGVLTTNVVKAAYMEQKEEMWPFLASRMDCGVCKKLVGEGVVIQVTLHDKRIVMQVTLHYEEIVIIVMQVTLHYEAIVMQVTLHDKRMLTTASFGVDDATDVKEICQVFNDASKELNVAKQS
nr:hypothetical protein [Tanacetum cinerariifolium]